MTVNPHPDPVYGAIEYVDEAVFDRPVLLVVIDTEEEFEWGKPHSRSSTGVSSMRHIHRVQTLFDARGVRPCYVMDYPVVSQADGAAPLLEIYQDDRCTTGAHLHPWVTPPYEEEVTAFNSFPGNLPADLEYRKLKVLTEEIGSVFGDAPTVYKAGRYGVGRNTVRTLERLQLTTDLSVTPGFDYSGSGGPDFSRHGNRPFRYGEDKASLCLPCTGGFVGYLGDRARPVYQACSSPRGKRLRLPGILSRLGAVERLRLSPEGYSLDEMIRLTEHLLKKPQTKVLTLSFHSPSVKPGCTPYVRNDRELDVFLGVIADYLDYFISEKQGIPMSPQEVHERQRSGGQA
jgi:hypothetical protein